MYASFDAIFVLA